MNNITLVIGLIDKSAFKYSKNMYALKWISIFENTTSMKLKKNINVHNDKMFALLLQTDSLWNNDATVIPPL